MDKKYIAIYDKTKDATDKVYNTKVYQYWINGNGELCRAKRADLDITAMLEPGAIEILS